MLKMKAIDKVDHIDQDLGFSRDQIDFKPSSTYSMYSVGLVPVACLIYFFTPNTYIELGNST